MRYLGLLLVLVVSLAASLANAQDAALLTRGEAVVTGFSGTKPADPPPAAGDPVDETFIDLDGASAQILKLEPGAPPTGQLITAPSALKVKARDVGQVFPITLDDGLLPESANAPPNIYLGQSSTFGLQIVLPDSDGDGRPERALVTRARGVTRSTQTKTTPPAPLRRTTTCRFNGPVLTSGLTPP